VHDDIIVIDDDVMMYSWKDPYSIGINLHKKTIVVAIGNLL